jgi:hypothetical protein
MTIGDMTINDVMPRWEIRSVHSITIRRPPDRVFEAIRTTDFAEHPLVRTMLGLRALPAAMGKNGWAEFRERAGQPVTLAQFEEQGFCVLAEMPPRELVLGLEGVFWSAGGGLRRITPESFRLPVPVGLARAAWSFSVVPLTDTESTLVTETRVVTGDVRSRRLFRVYWFSVGWGSGLIRHFILRSIKAEAERP